MHGLILLMGTETGGIYKFCAMFRAMGLRCGMPPGYLRDSLAASHMPQHEDLTWSLALRRFFTDMGLPSIAEVPPERVGMEEREYYASLARRCLERELKDGPFICADHLTSLVLPFVNEAIYGLPVQKIFFFAHPLREIATLKQRGQAPQLSEYVWRNTVTAAIRHGGRDTIFVETDKLDSRTTTELCRRIFEFYGIRLAIANNCSAPEPEALPPSGQFTLSRHTFGLYEALVAHAEKGDWESLEFAAHAAHDAQNEQNGWQFVNCLDCGELVNHARLLLAESQCRYSGENGEFPVELPDAEEDRAWQKLLDESERRLLQVRKEYAARLFINADSLCRFYMNEIHDVRAHAQYERSDTSKRRIGARRWKNMKRTSNGRSR